MHFISSVMKALRDYRREQNDDRVIDDVLVPVENVLHGLVLCRLPM